MKHLLKLGCKISILNFGATFITIEWLKTKFPYSLRLNPLITRDINHQKGVYEVASALIQMANNLSIKCIAEGVNDKSTLDKLIKMGCDSANGPIFSTPLPLEQYQLFVKQWNRDKLI